MNNKKILIIIVSLMGVLAAGILFFQYISSFHIIAITLSDTVTEATIEKLDNENYSKVETISSSKDVRLSEGEYRIIPTGETIDDKEVKFTIPAISAITIDPAFNESFLASRAEEEIVLVRDTLTSQFNESMSIFQINNYQLLKKGEWMGVVLVPSEFEFQNPTGVHRVVLEKKEDRWTTIGLPWPVLTKFNQPNIPVEILTQINNIPFTEE